MDEPRTNRFLGLLQTLVQHQVDFIVVGGVAALLEGAPILTLDLDVLYDPTPANIARLIDALDELKARYRDPAGRHIVPDIEKLRTMRTHLLLTDLGALDVLRTVGNALTYADLLDRTVEYELAGTRIQVLELAGVIETKEQANRDKDRAMLPVLRQTLAIKRTKPEG
jgi:hypothetical protein